MAPDEDYGDQYAAREARKLADRGVSVHIGAHGQREGLGSHWEMWSFERGGFTPIQAIEAATIAPARQHGMADDIGSLEIGKLADLVIIHGNPLENLRHSARVEMVMLNGRLYDAATLNETVSGKRRRTPYYWEN
jgi:imidazolonepropionase-like amidohydrolase